ncbi:kinase-like domain-containing protein [Entophlyctis helioformis]|nr:kinase-like domain-containing protein [Entophlyctis helioformis]
MPSNQQAPQAGKEAAVPRDPGIASHMASLLAKICNVTRVPHRAQQTDQPEQPDQMEQPRQAAIPGGSSGIVATKTVQKEAQPGTPQQQPNAAGTANTARRNVIPLVVSDAGANHLSIEQTLVNTAALGRVKTLIDEFGAGPCALLVPTSPAFAPRTRLSDYVMGAFIGKGGLGKVYAVVHIPTGLALACKVIERVLDCYGNLSRTCLTRNAHEVLIIKGHKAANTITSVDVIETVRLVFIIMPHVKTIRSSMVLKKDQAWSVIRKLYAGLHACHKSGFYHQDLKPMNVLVDKDMNVYLADFGAARFASPSERLYSSSGTRAYAAPEITVPFNGHRGPTTDMFSFGLTAFFYRYGHDPFPVQDTPAVWNPPQGPPLTIDDYSSDKIHFPIYASSDEMTFFERALAVNPIHRLNSHEIKSDRWITRHGQCPLVELDLVARPATEERPDHATIMELICWLDRLDIQRGWQGVDYVVECLVDPSHRMSIVRSVYLLLKQVKADHAAFLAAVHDERERARSVLKADEMTRPSPATQSLDSQMPVVGASKAAIPKEAILQPAVLEVPSASGKTLESSAKASPPFQLVTRKKGRKAH